MSQVSLIPTTKSPFIFQSHAIRTVIQGGQLWFVARDVCAALGIAWTGATLASIPSEWTSMLNLNMIQHNRKVKFISEPAVYKLAFRSNKPAADSFTNWVASEVIPAIRKTGKYEVKAAKLEPSASPTPSTVSDREPLRAIVNAWSRISGQPQNNLWPQVRAAFNITNIKQLPAEWVSDAIAWVQEKIDALPKSLPEPEQRTLPPMRPPS